jgi:Glycosyl transferase family 2
MESTKLSIAMCTYNGARYLPEQLQSFVDQTRQPDELVVCDDGSKDGTIELLRAFAARAPFAVQIHENERNLGYNQNFGKAIGLTTGDLIFLSDQDDVWHKEKLRTYLELYTKPPRPGLIFSDVNLVDSDLKSLGKTHWQAKGFGRSAHRKIAGATTGFSVMLKFPTWVTLGQTLAFPSMIKPLILPIPDGWFFDGWIATVASATGPIRPIKTPLNQYRQHNTQACGSHASLGANIAMAKGRAEGGSDHFLATSDRFGVLLERLSRHPELVSEKGWRERIEGKIGHWNARSRIHQRSRMGRLPLVAGEFVRGHYHAFSQDWKSLAMDLVF